MVLREPGAARAAAQQQQQQNENNAGAVANLAGNVQLIQAQLFRREDYNADWHEEDVK